MDFRTVRQKMATTQYALLAHTCSHRTQHNNNPADSTAHGTSVTWKHRPPSTVKCRHQPKVGRFRCISGYVPNRSHRGPAAAKHGWFWDSRQVEDGSVAGSGSQPNRMWDRKDRSWTQSGCCVNSTDCHEPSYTPKLFELFYSVWNCDDFWKNLVLVGGSLGAVLLVFAALNNVFLLHFKIGDWNLLVWYVGVLGII